MNPNSRYCPCCGSDRQSEEHRRRAYAAQLEETMTWSDAPVSFVSESTGDSGFVSE